jgi:hypothetical protein
VGEAAATRTCGVFALPRRPQRTSGQPVGASLATQQADPGRAEHHTPQDRGRGTASIVRDARVRSTCSPSTSTTAASTSPAATTGSARNAATTPSTKSARCSSTGTATGSGGPRRLLDDEQARYAVGSVGPGHPRSELVSNDQSSSELLGVMKVCPFPGQDFWRRASSGTPLQLG